MEKKLETSITPTWANLVRLKTLFAFSKQVEFILVGSLHYERAKSFGSNKKIIQLQIVKVIYVGLKRILSPHSLK